MSIYINNQVVQDPLAQTLLSHLANNPELVPFNIRRANNNVYFQAEALAHFLNQNPETGSRAIYNENDLNSLNRLLESNFNSSQYAAVLTEFERITSTPLNLSPAFRRCTSQALTNLTPLLEIAAPPLPEFSFNNTIHRRFATQLKTFLDGIQFDQANQILHPHTYRFAPTYNNFVGSRNVRELFAAHVGALTPAQSLALRFFLYNQPLSASEANTLFSSHGGGALRVMLERHHFLHVETDGSIRMNGLSVTSRRLMNGQQIYLAYDTPHDHYIFNAQPSAQLSSTSYTLLYCLEQDFQNRQHTFSGLVADFGSGVGIQGIALLKLYPQIQKVYALDIDEHSMNLSRFNALLNGVSERYEVLSNSNPQNLTQALNGRRLDGAVSNPPFNIVPHQYENIFTHFGYGGANGLAITQIFLNQAYQHLRPGAELVFYSVLGRTAQNFYLADWLRQNHSQGVELRAEALRLVNDHFDRAAYAVMLNSYLQYTFEGQSNHPQIPSTEEIQSRLGSLTSVDPYLLYFRRQSDSTAS